MNQTCEMTGKCMIQISGLIVYIVRQNKKLIIPAIPI